MYYSDIIFRISIFLVRVVLDCRRYAVITLKYPPTLSPEAILDHAVSASLPLATQFDPAECDTHIAVAISGIDDGSQSASPQASGSPNKRSQPNQAQNQPDQSPNQRNQANLEQNQRSGEVVLSVARLWRTKAQALQQLARAPAKLDSRQFEQLLKEKTSAHQGLEASVWSSSLSAQLHIKKHMFSFMV